MSRKRPSHKGFRRTRVFACFNSSFVASCNFLQPRFAKRRMSRKRPSYKGFRCIAGCIVHRHASRAFGPAGRRIACSGGAAPIGLGRCRGSSPGRATAGGAVASRRAKAKWRELRVRSPRSRRYAIAAPPRGAYACNANTRDAHSCMAVRDALVRVAPICDALVRGAYTHGGYTRIVVRDALIRARGPPTRDAHTLGGVCDAYTRLPSGVQTPAARARKAGS